MADEVKEEIENAISIEDTGEKPIEDKEVSLDADDITLDLGEQTKPTELPDEAVQAAKKELLDKEKQEKVKKVTQMNEYIWNSVGGKEKFALMTDTLRTGLDATTRESLNAKLMSGNKTLVNEALKIAVEKYKKIKGFGGERMEGDANTVSDPVLRLTKEDYRLIMRTEKYKTDPVYRNKIDAARLKTRSEDQAKYGPGTYYGYNQSGRYEL